MTPYEQLTASGKLRRLHALAEAALGHYGLLASVCQATNRVTGTGDRSAMFVTGLCPH